MDWISIDELLPDYGVTVIVDGGIAYRRAQDDGKWWSLTAFDYPGKPIQWKVKYWMPIPTTPVSIGPAQ